MCGEISSFMEFVKRKQDETDQGTFREESLIQNSSWFSVRSEKRANFLRVRKPRSRINHAHMTFLLDFTASKLRSVMLKILRVLRFDKVFD